MIDPLNPDYNNTPASPLRPRYDYAPTDPAGVQPVVSIITPFFNGGEVFEDTIRSILAQSMQQFEWLIVDDGTTDETSLAILERADSLDPRVRVVRVGKNTGLPAARNFGARLARAPYVALIDNDDLFEPTALEKLCWALEAQPQYAFAEGYSISFGAKNYLWRHGSRDGDVMLESNQIVGRSVIRKDAYFDVGGMPEHRRNGLEDWEFWFRCASKGYWGQTIPEFFDWYRRRPDHSDRWSDFAGGAKQTEFLNKMRAQFPEVFRRGVPRIEKTHPLPYSVVDFKAPFSNPLAKGSGTKRMLCIFPHLELGGSDKFNLDMISELQTNFSYEVTVVTTLPAEHRWRHHFESVTPDVFTLNTFLPIPDYPRFIRYLIESRDFDVIMISNSQLGYLLTPFLRAIADDRPIIDYIHMEEEKWRSGNYPRYSINYSGYTDLTIVASEHLKDWMVSRGGDSARIEVCTINIDSDQWTRERFNQKLLCTKYNIPKDLPVISFAARLTDQKQPKVLAEVIRLLRDQGARFVCLLAGDGPHFNALNEYVARHSLTELRLLGAVSNADVQEILAISDICFMPSEMEGIALIFYEAMAMGVVPVGAAVGGQAELVTPECGYLVEHGPNEVMAYVKVLAELLLDPGLRRKMSTAARQRIEQKFELRDMGKRMSALLDRAMAGPRHTPDMESIGATTAIEAMEQHRLETVAEELWAARGTNFSPVVLGEDASYIDYYEYLKRLRSILAGNALAIPGLLKNQNCSAVGLAKSVGLLYSGTPSATRRMLHRILAQPTGRALLAKIFRPQDYLARNPDVQAAHLEPLLHYVARGMAEERIPVAGMRRGAQILEQTAEAMNQANQSSR